MIASAEVEAQRLARELNKFSDPRVGCKRSSGRFRGATISPHLRLDRPLAPEDFPEPDSVEAARRGTEVILSLVRREKLTLRQLLAADGFNIMPPLLRAIPDVLSAEASPCSGSAGR